MNIWVVIAIMVVSTILQYALTPRAKSPQNADPSLESDFDFPQSEEGTPQIVVFGDVFLPDWYVLWHGNYRVEPITADGGGGKK